MNKTIDMQIKDNAEKLKRLKARALKALTAIDEDNDRRCREENLWPLYGPEERPGEH